ncbi:MAG: restriction endonuclease subunit S [Rikenellaceae bacterium]
MLVYSVTNNVGFIKQSDRFEDREIAGEDTSTYKIIKQGEFAYNPARINVGSIARYYESTPCIISSLYVCFKPKSIVCSDWLLHLLKSDRILYYYNIFAEGGVRQYLFYPNFARIKVKLPSLNEQIRIADAINSIDVKLKLEELLYDSFNRQKTYLLSQMFI